MAQFGDFKCDQCDRDIAADPEDPFVVTITVGVTPTHNREFPDIDSLPGVEFLRRIHKSVRMREELCLGCTVKEILRAKKLPAKEVPEEQPQEEEKSE